MLDEQSFYEVFAVGPGNRFTDYTHTTGPIAGNKVSLTWTGSTSLDVDFYRVYNDDQTGIIDFNTVIATVDHLGVVTHTFKSDALDDGTWKFAVRAVDNANNQELNVIEVTIVLDSLPKAVTDLAFTFNETSDKVTLTWTASTSSDISKYNIFSNSGSGLVDYSTPIAVINHPTVTFESAAIVAAGTYNFAVRSEDTGGKEEKNTDRVISIVILDSPIREKPDLPNAPIGLTVTPIEGGKFTVTWLYDQANEEVTPDFLALYFDNATGTVDFVTPLTTLAFSAGVQENKYKKFTFTTAVLVDASTYIFAVRARIGTEEEKNTVTVSAVADATAPNAPTSLVGVETF